MKKSMRFLALITAIIIAIGIPIYAQPQEVEAASTPEVDYYRLVDDWTLEIHFNGTVAYDSTAGAHFVSLRLIDQYSRLMWSDVPFADIDSSTNWTVAETGYPAQHVGTLSASGKVLTFTLTEQTLTLWQIFSIASKTAYDLAFSVQDNNANDADRSPNGLVDQVTVGGVKLPAVNTSGYEPYYHRFKQELRSAKVVDYNRIELEFTGTYSTIDSTPLAGVFCAVRVLDNMTDQNLHYQGSTPIQASVVFDFANDPNRHDNKIEVYINSSDKTLYSYLQAVQEGNIFEGKSIAFCIEDNGLAADTTTKSNGFIELITIAGIPIKGTVKRSYADQLYCELDYSGLTGAYIESAYWDAVEDGIVLQFSEKVTLASNTAAYLGAYNDVYNQQLLYNNNGTVSTTASGTAFRYAVTVQNCSSSLNNDGTKLVAKASNLYQKFQEYKNNSTLKSKNAVVAICFEQSNGTGGRFTTIKDTATNKGILTTVQNASSAGNRTLCPVNDFDLSITGISVDSETGTQVQVSFNKEVESVGPAFMAFRLVDSTNDMIRGEDGNYLQWHIISDNWEITGNLSATDKRPVEDKETGKMVLAGYKPMVNGVSKNIVYGSLETSYYTIQSIASRYPNARLTLCIEDDYQLSTYDTTAKKVIKTGNGFVDSISGAGNTGKVTTNHNSSKGWTDAIYYDTDNLVVEQHAIEVTKITLDSDSKCINVTFTDPVRFNNDSADVTMFLRVVEDETDDLMFIDGKGGFTREEIDADYALQWPISLVSPANGTSNTYKFKMAANTRPDVKNYIGNITTVQGAIDYVANTKGLGKAYGVAFGIERDVLGETGGQPGLKEGWYIDGATSPDGRKSFIGSVINHMRFMAPFHNFDLYGAFAYDSVSLSDSFVYNVYVKSTKIPSGAKAEFTRNRETFFVSESHTDSSGAVGFSLRDLTPQCMTDLIKVTITDADGNELFGKTTSIINYLTSLKSTYPQYANLVNDMLVYGGAAQRYTGHSLDKPADKGYTITAYSKPSQTRTVTHISNPSAQIKGANMYFDSVNRIKFRFVTNDINKTTFKLTKPDGTTYSPAYTKENVNGAVAYYVTTEGIYAYRYATPVTLQIYYDGVLQGTVKYCVNDYAYAKWDDPKTELKDLVRSMYAYGKAASALKS